MTFGQRVQGSEGKNVTRTVELDVEGKDSVFEVKQKIAVSTGYADHTAAGALIAVTPCRFASWQAAFGNKVAPAQFLLYFGPNEAVLGQQYEGDPAVDEHSLLLSEYSCLAWLQKFPQWHLSVRFMAPTPLPPGVAAHRAAALSEGKDPDVAVRDARNKARLCITPVEITEQVVTMVSCWPHAHSKWSTASIKSTAIKGCIFYRARFHSSHLCPSLGVLRHTSRQRMTIATDRHQSLRPAR